MCKFLLACILLFFAAVPVYAIDLVISSVPETVQEDTAIGINYLLSQGSSANATVYLRAVFYKEGTTKYFGYTQNQKNVWINSTADKSAFYELTVSPEGTASGTIQAKLDMEHSYFEGAGVYKIKLGRYTSATDTSADWSNELETAVTVRPTPTPNPSPTSTPSPTPTTTPTPSPSPTPKPSPSPKPSPLPSIKQKEEGTVAGATTEINLSGYGPASPVSSPSPASIVGKPVLNHDRARTALLVGSGLILTALAGYVVYYRYQKHNLYTKENEESD